MGRIDYSVGNMMTQIGTSITLKKSTVTCPMSVKTLKVAYVLEQEGYIAGCYGVNAIYTGNPLDPVPDNEIPEFDRSNFRRPCLLRDDNPNFIIALKYSGTGKGRKSIINGVKVISTPSSPVSVTAKNIPVVHGGSGIAILGTSSGIMTNKQAKTLGVGGEVLFYVW